MDKTKKAGLTTIAAFALAACTFATLGMAKGMSASAEEVTPEPAAQGWYIVGNGAGSLKDCSWNNYVPGFKLNGSASKEGTFTFEDLELYEGDAFKILYASGEWVYPSESKWGADVQVQYSDLDNTDEYFVNGGLGNIQTVKSGMYDLTLKVSEAGAFTLTYQRTSDVTPIAQEEMYIVGSLENYPECNWPGAIDVATKCPKMTLEGNKWKIKLNLVKGDQFKVYNLVNNGYFPSGLNNNYVVAESGWYEVEYEEKAPDFIVTPTTAPVTPAE